MPGRVRRKDKGFIDYDINWSNLDQVTHLADELHKKGAGHFAVYKLPRQARYSIFRTRDLNRYKISPSWVKHYAGRTDEKQASRKAKRSKSYRP